MLILYYKPTCPFCQKVLGEAEEMGVSFDLRDISSDETNAEALIEAGGKRQVPFLVDTDRDVSLYESDDIIAYLREQYSKAGDGAPQVCDSCQ